MVSQYRHLLKLTTITSSEPLASGSPLLALFPQGYLWSLVVLLGGIPFKANQVQIPSLVSSQEASCIIVEVQLAPAITLFLLVATGCSV